MLWGPPRPSVLLHVCADRVVPPEPAEARHDHGHDTCKQGGEGGASQLPPCTSTGEAPASKLVCLANLLSEKVLANDAACRTSGPSAASLGSSRPLSSHESERWRAGPPRTWANASSRTRTRPRRPGRLRPLYRDGLATDPRALKSDCLRATAGPSSLCTTASSTDWWCRPRFCRHRFSVAPSGRPRFCETVRVR